MGHKKNKNNQTASHYTLVNRKCFRVQRNTGNVCWHKGMNNYYLTHYPKHALHYVFCCPPVPFSNFAICPGRLSSMDYNSLSVWLLFGFNQQAVLLIDWGLKGQQGWGLIPYGFLVQSFVDQLYRLMKSHTAPLCSSLHIAFSPGPAVNFLLLYPQVQGWQRSPYGCYSQGSSDALSFLSLGFAFVFINIPFINLFIMQFEYAIYFLLKSD